MPNGASKIQPGQASKVQLGNLDLEKTAIKDDKQLGTTKEGLQVTTSEPTTYVKDSKTTDSLLVVSETDNNDRQARPVEGEAIVASSGASAKKPPEELDVDATATIDESDDFLSTDTNEPMVEKQAVDGTLTNTYFADIDHNADITDVDVYKQHSYKNRTYKSLTTLTAILSKENITKDLFKQTYDELLKGTNKIFLNIEVGDETFTLIPLDEYFNDVDDETFAGVIEYTNRQIVGFFKTAFTDKGYADDAATTKLTQFENNSAKNKDLREKIVEIKSQPINVRIVSDNSKEEKAIEKAEADKEESQINTMESEPVPEPESVVGRADTYHIENVTEDDTDDALVDETEEKDTEVKDVHSSPVSEFKVDVSRNIMIKASATDENKQELAKDTADNTSQHAASDLLNSALDIGDLPEPVKLTSVSDKPEALKDENKQELEVDTSHTDLGVGTTQFIPYSGSVDGENIDDSLSELTAQPPKAPIDESAEVQKVASTSDEKGEMGSQTFAVRMPVDLIKKNKSRTEVMV